MEENKTNKPSNDGPYRVEPYPEALYVVGHGVCLPFPSQREATLKEGELRALLIRRIDPDAMELTIAALNGADWDEIDPDAGGPGAVANPFNLKYFTHNAIVKALGQFANTWAKPEYIPLIDRIVRRLEGK